MLNRDQFQIMEVEGGYAFVGNGLFQNIDFLNGGAIPTPERASELLDVYIETMNNPASITPPKPLIDKLQEINQKIETQNQIIDQLVIDALMGR